MSSVASRFMDSPCCDDVRRFYRTWWLFGMTASPGMVTDGLGSRRTKNAKAREGVAPEKLRVSCVSEPRKYESLPSAFHDAEPQGTNDSGPERTGMCVRLPQWPSERREGSDSSRPAETRRCILRRDRKSVV